MISNTFYIVNRLVEFELFFVLAAVFLRFSFHFWVFAIAGEFLDFSIIFLVNFCVFLEQHGGL